MDTTDLIRRAQKALEGKHPEHGFPIPDGEQAAMPYLLLALVQEQQATNQHLARIAEALEQKPQQEPKRRLWLPRHRNA